MEVFSGLNTVLPSGSGGGGSGLDAEQVRDTIAAFATGTAPITITHNDSANTLTFALASGAIPSKASDDEARAGTNSANFMTAETTSAAIKYARTSDLPEASLTGMELVGSNSIDAANEMKLNTGNFLNIRISAANYAKIKGLLHNGNTVEFIATDGTVEMTTTMDRATEFDEGQSIDDIVINLDSLGGLSLTSNFTNLTLRIRAKWADGFEGAIDDFLSTNMSAANTSIVVTHATGDNHGVTIAVGTVTPSLLKGIDSSSAGNLEVSSNGDFIITSGGGGVTFATADEAKALTATDKALSPGTFNAALGADLTSLVIDGDDALTYTTTTESQLPAGTFRIDADRNVTLRAKDAAMTAKFEAKLAKGKDIEFRKNDSKAAAEIISAVTKTDISGSDADQFSFVVSAHTASGTEFTNNSSGFTLEVVSPLLSDIFNNIPDGAISIAALSGVINGKSQIKEESGDNTILGTATDTTWYPVPRNKTNGSDSQALFTVTPQSASSKFVFIFIATVGWWGSDQSRGDFRLAKSTDGSTFNEVSGSLKTNVIHTGGNPNGNPHVNISISVGFGDAPNTTEQIYYRVEARRNSSNVNRFGLEGQTAIMLETQ